MNSDELNKGEPGADPVCVFRTGDDGLAAVVKSILEVEGIRYIARSVETRELFGAGGDGGGPNYTVGSVDFLVARDDAERVRHVLDALRAGFLSGGAGEDGDSGE
jgi:hypothetical protein